MIRKAKRLNRNLMDRTMAFIAIGASHRPNIISFRSNSIFICAFFVSLLRPLHTRRGQIEEIRNPNTFEEKMNVIRFQESHLLHISSQFTDTNVSVLSFISTHTHAHIYTCGVFLAHKSWIKATIHFRTNVKQFQQDIRIEPLCQNKFPDCRPYN